jgi:hypothetical protein
MMTRSVRRNGRTGSGNGSLQEKPTGAEEEKNVRAVKEWWVFLLFGSKLAEKKGTRNVSEL